MSGIFSNMSCTQTNVSGNKQCIRYLMQSDVKHIKLATGHIGLATGHIGLATGHIGLATGHIGLGTGHIGLATGHIGLGTGHTDSATGKLKKTKEYWLRYSKIQRDKGILV
jgi:hypothetical protein